MVEDLEAYLERQTLAVRAGLRVVPFDDRLYVPEKVLLVLLEQRGASPERVRQLVAAGLIRPQRWQGYLPLFNVARSADRLPYVEALQRAGRLSPGVMQVMLAFEHAWEETLWEKLQGTRRREFQHLDEASEKAVRIQVVQAVSVVERINRLREHVRDGRRLSGQARAAFDAWVAVAPAPSPAPAPSDLAAPHLDPEALREARRIFLGET